MFSHIPPQDECGCDNGLVGVCESGQIPLTDNVGITTVTEPLEIC